jgi:hypothetical protein
LEKEIVGKSGNVPFYLLIEPFGCGSEELSQISIQHHLLAAHGEDSRFNFRFNYVLFHTCKPISELSNLS